MQILIFNSLLEAQTALTEVDAALGLPKVNYNALTGQPEPGREGTDTWAIIHEVYSEPGKYYFSAPGNGAQEAITEEYIEVLYDRAIHDAPLPAPYPPEIIPVPGDD